MSPPGAPTDWDRLAAFDQQHVWHPYGPLPAPSRALPVVSASGTRITLADGRELVDGMSSWWAAIWGYRHPTIDAAMERQLRAMAHVMFGGLTHRPAIELAETLIGLLPPGLDRVFLADSGSVAVEVALKLAVQYHQALGQARRVKFAALSGGYHGDTLGAMSVCDPVNGMHHLFGGAVPRNHFLPRPPRGHGVDTAWAEAAAALMDAHGDEVAAVIAEPVVQGAGGMWFYDEGYVRALKALAESHGALLILDEIATGFGRTGEMFAASGAGVSADIMCVGKSLTAGYLSLAAMICTERVATIASRGDAGGLMHGPTYMANPLACAAATASLSLLSERGWQTKVKTAEKILGEALGPAVSLAGVKDVRVLGAIGVVQLDHPVDVPKATAEAMSKGVWLRPFRDLVYTMPPYIASSQELEMIAGAVVAAAKVG